ncbi:MAG TPA: VIT1/CCC1 transporter family protein [Sedimentisphaerales bacterium]|jgi:VIT1/CCC1 family predicted Fe2+/Mn2+ transporter|nr:VIT1/CCC1 transporter family protein [Sedimentisphaerales bacterium]HNU28010.1 VIT1/CCC1 transporter family protein [Sedimentisphaerales bacterium]
MDLSPEIRQKLLAFQRVEITENHIYSRLAGTVKSAENRKVLEKIAADEMRHYEQWRAYTQENVAPDHWAISKYFWISQVLGFTFGVKLMENAEEKAQGSYEQLLAVIPEAEAIMKDEQEHETALLAMLDEERLRYTGSMVLGLNDALVELTGALAGLTLALRDAKLIALTGSVTGIAAALSMAASSYLSTKSEETTKNPLKASVYTGVAYLLTVLVLIFPYMVLSNYFVSLACTLVAAIGIIAAFNYYISVARSEPFKSRFLEMAGLSLGVAAFSFLVGFVLRTVFGVDA